MSRRWRLLALFALSTLLLASAAMIWAAGTAGLWTPVATMPTNRSDHTAVTLLDNKILVAGGIAVGNGITVRLNSALLYRPDSDDWLPVSRMSSLRSEHGAAFMPNGKVLVAGGYVSQVVPPPLRADLGGDFFFPCGPSPSVVPGTVGAAAEIFDESTLGWTAAASMNAARAEFTLVPMANGLILAPAGASTATAELYNPATDSWSFTSPMQVVHTGAATAGLPDGRVLVAGGNVGTVFLFGNCPTTGEFYDPSIDTWTQTGPMLSNRYHATATVVRVLDGSHQILVAGGLDGNDPSKPVLDTAELWNPNTNTFISAGTMLVGRAFHSATLLPDGKVLVTGGIDSLGDAETRSEVYDPIANSWTLVNPTIFPHASHTATPLFGGSKVVVAGGNSGALLPTATVEIFQPTPLASQTEIDAPPLFGSAISACLPGSVKAFVSSKTGTGAPTGSVNFTDLGALIFGATLTDGVATLAADLPAGTYSLDANYFGDAAFLGSNAPTTMVQSVAPPIQISGPNIAGAGRPITLVATVPAGAVAPYNFIWLGNGLFAPGSSVTVTPQLGSNVYSVLGSDSNSCDLNPAAFTVTGLPVGVNLVIRVIGLSRDASTGDLIAVLTVTEQTADTAANVQVTTAFLNTTPTKTTVPLALGSLGASAAASFVLRYPGSAAAPGTTALLHMNLTYTDLQTGIGGNGGGSFRVAVP